MSTTYGNVGARTAGVSDALVLAGRALASVIFIHGGWAKLMGMAATKLDFGHFWLRLLMNRT